MISSTAHRTQEFICRTPVYYKGYKGRAKGRCTGRWGRTRSAGASFLWGPPSPLCQCLTLALWWLAALAGTNPRATYWELLWSLLCPTFSNVQDGSRSDINLQWSRGPPTPRKQKAEIRFLFPARPGVTFWIANGLQEERDHLLDRLRESETLTLTLGKLHEVGHTVTPCGQHLLKDSMNAGEKFLEREKTAQL